MNRFNVRMDNGEYEHEIIDRAILFATRAFAGQDRKLRGEPAVFHALEAGEIAATVTADSEIIAACILHDTIEDAGVTEEELEKEFGKRTASLVAMESENKREDRPAEETWHERKQEALDLLAGTDDIGIKVMFLSDKLSNIRAIRSIHYVMGDELWNRFHQKNPREHKWYYETILHLTEPLKNTAAWLEYQELVQRVFEKYE